LIIGRVGGKRGGPGGEGGDYFNLSEWVTKQSTGSTTQITNEEGGGFMKESEGSSPGILFIPEYAGGGGKKDAGQACCYEGEINT